MTDTPALYKMSLSSLSKQLKFGGPDQCRSCSGHLCGSAFRPLKGKSGPASYSNVRVIASRFLHQICLLIDELDIRGTKVTLNARLGTEITCL